jgi:hypothetical protein
MVAVPFAEHVGAPMVITGTVGTGNCAAILKDADAAEVHEPLPDVTV